MGPTAADARAIMALYRDLAAKAGATKGFATQGVSDFLKDGWETDATVITIPKLIPDMGDFTIHYIAKVYAAPGLDPKQRALLVLSTLITQGAEPELEIHTHTALNVGLLPREVAAVPVNLIPYVGFPSVLNALKVIVRVFKERGIDIAKVGLEQAALNKTKPAKEPGRVIMREYRDMGKALGANVGMAMPGGPSFAKDTRIIAPQMRDIQEETGDWIYARPGFTKHQRSLVILSSLITQGVDPEVHIHVHTALNVGLTAREIVAIGWTLVPYVGFPRSFNGLKVMAAVFKERGLSLEEVGKGKL
ncbi:CMD-domain-containing protein [Gonapodya prolifera JEL478]|uniref:CMD-domain-containing protein n=1 Tax=Gonapodya prolifera (strain JEL478) TaxID=1344416 RepID=A0A138ZX47_GONPJ|nr:CMD-domain-containing protein [Gonapodya prolifera JEL478]|eukprot:KXS09021.1 CMD-domain-containing protein [Gonapodya prolifera JEL478]